MVCAQPVALGEMYADTFLCMACSLGQFCPSGSRLPNATSPSIQFALDALECPSGSYCPDPSSRLPCPAGSFCGQGAVAPVTCAMDTLLATVPGMVVPQEPTSVYRTVYVDGTTLGGNYCPANSTNPNTECAGGTYCPTPDHALPCPKGHFCKAGSKDPTPCPFLTSCPEGSSKAALSWTGFILLAGILLGLLVAYGVSQALMRVAQRRQLYTQEARDRLWKLLTPIFAPAHRQGDPAFRAFTSIRPRLHIEFRDLGCVLHDGRTILAGVTGRFEHSRVSAIMGPSGAGKTTFLSVLMGRAGSYGRCVGSLRINGRAIGVPQLRSVVGFVPQDDIVHEDLTVRENLVYSARLRLSTSKPRREQLDLVDDVLGVLQLRHVQHQVVGSVERRGISGGQRKRVSIGLELAAKPSILFMDEPTSGLDATAAADILQALKRMAGLGMNVVAVLHQPRYSIFALFDEVMLLGKGGHLVFLGPSRLAMPYFESLDFELPPHENPADFVMDVISGSVPQRGHGAFHPDRLPALWEAYGLAWVRTQRRLSDGAAPPPPAQQLRIDPEQLALLEEQFDAADDDGDGALRAPELQQVLRGLGLEPSVTDVQMIMAELAVPRTGLISRETFLSYVRHGGRPPAPEPGLGAAGEPGAAAGGRAGQGGRRAVQSIYRVYSIEQYTLSAAIAELSAATLPPGLQSPPGNLRELAAAVVAAGHGADGPRTPPPAPDAGPVPHTFQIIPLPESSAEESAAGDSPTAHIRRRVSLAPNLPAVVEEEDQEGEHGRLGRVSGSSGARSLDGASPRGVDAQQLPAPRGTDGDEHRLEELDDPVVHSRSSTASHDAPVAIHLDSATPLASPRDRPNPMKKGVSWQDERSLRSIWDSINTRAKTQAGGPKHLSTHDEEISSASSVSGGGGAQPTSSVSSSGSASPGMIRSHTPSCDVRGAGASSTISTESTAYGAPPRRRRWPACLRCLGSKRPSRLRVTPGYARQYVFLLVRAGIKLSRGWGSKFLDLLLLVFAGVVTGAMHGTGWTNWDFRPHIGLIMLTLGIISSSTALGVFGKDRLVHWRERDSGVRVLSYFFANSTINVLDVLLQPLVFLSVYYSMTLPNISFGALYALGVLVVFWCSSLGCLMSIILGQGALVACVAVIMVVGGFINGVNPVYRTLSPMLKGLTVLSYNRWATETAAIWDFQKQPSWQWPETRSILFAAGQCGMDAITEPPAGSKTVPQALLDMSLDVTVYCQGYDLKAIGILAAQGVILRFFAFLALLLCPRGLSLDPLIRPKTFSLSSPLATNLFEDFAVKDGNLSFDALDNFGATPLRKRKHELVSSSDFADLAEGGPHLAKVARQSEPEQVPRVDEPALREERARDLAAEVNGLMQVLAELEASVVEAEKQNVIVNEENRDLWATLSYLQRCLRLGLQARIVTRSPAPCHSSGAAPARRRAAPSAPPRRSRLAEPLHQHTSSRASEPVRTLMATTPTGCKVHGLTPLAISEPDVGGLASAMLSPGTEELFAVACNMFLSPGKPLGGLTPVGRGGGPGSHLFAGLLPSPLPAAAHGGAAPSPGLSVAGHKRLFAEELDILAAGHIDLGCCPPCPLPELDDEIFAGLDF